MRYAKLIAAVALLIGASTWMGCSTYRIGRFNDHGGKPVTQLETHKRTSYLGLWTSVEHQFWLCDDTGDQLVCKRRCGGDTDLECPAASAGMGGISTNVR